MANAIDKAVRAQGGAVVKPHQVKAMILAARRAYIEQAKLGLVNDGVGFDAWRRATIHDVVGAAAPSSFRMVTQRDYARVVAYFLELAGCGCGTEAAPSRDKEADEQRRALWALNLAEGEVEDQFGGRAGAGRYADALFAKIHRTDRHSATARQIWAVIFTLRNRAKGRARRPAPYETGEGRVRRPAPDETDERRARTAIGALEASGVPLSPPDGSKRFPAFSRAL